MRANKSFGILACKSLARI